MRCDRRMEVDGAWVQLFIGLVLFFCAVMEMSSPSLATGAVGVSIGRGPNSHRILEARAQELWLRVWEHGMY